MDAISSLPLALTAGTRIGVYHVSAQILQNFFDELRRKVPLGK